MRLLIFLLLICSAPVFGQREKFDIITFTPLKGWTREEKSTLVSFTKVDNLQGTWARIIIYKSVNTTGSVDNDFQHDWTELVAKPYNAENTPSSTGSDEADGWKIKAGGTKFSFNNADAFAFMTTFSGYGIFTSIVATTNAQDYTSQITTFTESIELTKPQVSASTPETTKASTVAAPATMTNSNPSPSPAVGASVGFNYTSTNWDDGWVSIAREDWVEVAKGKITVLLHYPKDGTVIPADPAPLLNNAWNILVAPRYSKLRNYKVANSITEYERAYLVTANVTDNKTGKDVFVALFRKGQSGWIEIITPDKATFVQDFGFDPDQITWASDSDIFKPLLRFPGYNRFALALSDFKGKWTSDFSGMLQMYSVYTGNYAGMNVSQSNETFVFTGNSYTWKFLSVNGMVGNLKYANAESAGTFSVPEPWKFYCSKIESKPKTYNAYWSCIKGGRVLNLRDASFTEGSFTMFGKADK